MVDMRVTDVARLGVLWRSGRARAALIRGVVVLGSLAVATGGGLARARGLPAWRGREAVPAGAAARRRPAARLNPRSVETRLLLATALRRAGDMNGMAREYTEVRRLAPSGPLGELARQALNERSIR